MSNITNAHVLAMIAGDHMDAHIMVWCEEDRIVGLSPAQRTNSCEHKFVSDIHHGSRCLYCREPNPQGES